MTARIFSASQVDTFMCCPRKWAWKYIAGIKPAQANSAKIGDETHKQLETHLGGGKIDFTKVVHGVRIGDVIAPGLNLLPAPCAPGMTIESKFDFPSLRGGWSWTGRKDIECDDSFIFPNLHAEMCDAVEGPVQPAPAVSDHKTTSGLNWAKTPDELFWDVQANLYAYELAERRNADAVDLVWTNYQTRGAKKAKRVHLRVARDHARDAFARIETIAAQMAQHHAASGQAADKHAYVHSMRANVGHCESFGGCPYRGECSLTLTEQERFKASMSGGDFFSNLANVAAADDAKAGVPAMAVPSASDVFANAQADAAQVVPSTPPPDTAPVAINPPESLIAANVPSAPPVSAPAPTEPAAEPAKRGRGRPRKNEVRGTTAEQAAAPIGSPGKEMPGQVIVGAPGQVLIQNRAVSFHLYVDCLPDGIELDYADELIELANAKVVEQSKSTDKPVGHYKFLQYGQAAGALDIALQQVLEEQAPVAIFCASVSDALPTLTRKASGITRSVR